MTERMEHNGKEAGDSREITPETVVKPMVVPAAEYARSLYRRHDMARTVAPLSGRIMNRYRTSQSPVQGNAALPLVQAKSIQKSESGREGTVDPENGKTFERRSVSDQPPVVQRRTADAALSVSVDVNAASQGAVQSTGFSLPGKTRDEVLVQAKTDRKETTRSVSSTGGVTSGTVSNMERPVMPGEPASLKTVETVSGKPFEKKTDAVEMPVHPVALKRFESGVPPVARTMTEQISGTETVHHDRVIQREPQAALPMAADQQAGGEIFGRASGNTAVSQNLPVTETEKSPSESVISVKAGETSHGGMHAGSTDTMVFRKGMETPSVKLSVTDVNAKTETATSSKQGITEKSKGGEKSSAFHPVPALNTESRPESSRSWEVKRLNEAETVPVVDSRPAETPAIETLVLRKESNSGHVERVTEYAGHTQNEPGKDRSSHDGLDKTNRGFVRDNVPGVVLAVQAKPLPDTRSGEMVLDMVKRNAESPVVARVSAPPGGESVKPPHTVMAGAGVVKQHVTPFKPVLSRSFSPLTRLDAGLAELKRKQDIRTTPSTVHGDSGQMVMAKGLTPLVPERGIVSEGLRTPGSESPESGGAVDIGPFGLVSKMPMPLGMTLGSREERIVRRVEDKISRSMGGNTPETGTAEQAPRSAAAQPAVQDSTPEPRNGFDNIEALADQVYDRIMERLTVEKESQGL
jgi:hypothetical protein